MTANDLCMQIQADVLGVQVSRPVVVETTALGAAYAAGLAVGFWSSTDELRANWPQDKRWEPRWSPGRRATGYAAWRKAVDRTSTGSTPTEGHPSTWLTPTEPRPQLESAPTEWHPQLGRRRLTPTGPSRTNAGQALDTALQPRCNSCCGGLGGVTQRGQSGSVRR